MKTRLTVLCCSTLALMPWTAQAAETRLPEHTDTPAPWTQTVAAKQVSPLYQQQWRRAENRRQCALIALPRNSAAQQSGAQARAAAFSGGWAVAYDLPGQRSAYGVVGAGIGADEASIQRWPNRRHWADGSAAGYGLRGGSGPGYLAYVRVAGQSCLYNVWSNISQRHLEQMLADLRRVHR